MERWFDFKRDFELKDLSPRSHLELSKSFLENPASATRYNEFRNKLDLTESVDCDVVCMRKAFCNTFTSIVEHKTICYGKDVVKFNEHADLVILTTF
jgi:hypothetical protein